MKKAFTLIEILVVVTIIAVLASIAAISYSSFIKQSRDARRRTDIEQTRAAIELYRNFNGTYPPAIVFGTGTIQDASTTYLSKVSNDPMSTGPSSNTYFYSTTGMDYTICAYLEGGESTSETAICGTSLDCNYCMGPYGQK